MAAGILDSLSKDDARKLHKCAQPRWTAPMLATLTDVRFSDRDWIFERKLDGERALVFRQSGKTRLMTRNRREITSNYPELAAAFDGQSGDFIVDGEIVAFDGNVTSFSRLQQRMQISDPEKAAASGVKVFMYLFDILYLDGNGLDDLPLRSRKAILRKAIDFDDPLRFVQHRNEQGEAYFADACRRGWEGVIAKDATSRYEHRRSRSWLKFKCANGQELVIGGFTEPKGSREGFGALLVGYYENDELRYAGKVGTGYDDTFLVEFRDRLDQLARKTSPFSEEHPDDPEITWVRPEIVAEFGFTEWTRAGRLRHPRFLGLRRDKEASEVVRETPA